MEQCGERDVVLTDCVCDYDDYFYDGQYYDHPDYYDYDDPDYDGWDPASVERRDTAGVIDSGTPESRSQYS